MKRDFPPSPPLYICLYLYLCLDSRISILIEFFMRILLRLGSAWAV